MRAKATVGKGSLWRLFFLAADPHRRKWLPCLVICTAMKCCATLRQQEV